MRELKVNGTKAKLQEGGIQIQPSTKEDYGTIIKILERNRLEFYTNTLSEYRTILVVVKEIPEEKMKN